MRDGGHATPVSGSSSTQSPLPTGRRGRGGQAPFRAGKRIPARPDVEGVAPAEDRTEPQEDTDRVGLSPCADKKNIGEGARVRYTPKGSTSSSSTASSDALRRSFFFCRERKRRRSLHTFPCRFVLLASDVSKEEATLVTLALGKHKYSNNRLLWCTAERCRSSSSSSSSSVSISPASCRCFRRLALTSDEEANMVEVASGGGEVKAVCENEDGGSRTDVRGGETLLGRSSSCPCGDSEHGAGAGGTLTSG